MSNFCPRRYIGVQRYCSLPVPFFYTRIYTHTPGYSSLEAIRLLRTYIINQRYDRNSQMPVYSVTGSRYYRNEPREVSSRRWYIIKQRMLVFLVMHQSLGFRGCYNNIYIQARREGGRPVSINLRVQQACYLWKSQGEK